MLEPRIIPSILIHNNGLVKTQAFGNPKYIGDPLNTVRIFNEKNVDELIIADIDCSIRGGTPKFALLEKLAYESNMPLCYAGGVSSIDDVERLISIGIEKIGIGTAAFNDKKLIEDSSQRFGAQSIVGVVDYKEVGVFSKSRYVHLKSGTINTKITPEEHARVLQNLGVGEILLNCINKDGSLSGYDYDCIRSVKNQISIPLTVLGGASSLEDISKLIREHKFIGAAAGSIFVFKGKYRAVLINYPDYETRRMLY